MFASPNQVPKCPWLRKSLYRQNKSMDSPGGEGGRSERGVSVPSFTFPAPGQGGQQETSHSPWEVMGQTLLGTGGSCAAPVQKCRSHLRHLSGAAGRQA